MDQIFKMTNQEKIYKAAYENGGEGLLNKPMAYAVYETINQELRKYYRSTEKYHEDITTNSPGNTIRDVSVSGDAVEVVLHSRYSYPIMHNHQYIELIYVYQGECTHFVEKETFIMKEGNLCIMTPTAMHAVSAPSDDAVILNIMMSRKMFNGAFLKMLRGNKILSEFFENVLYDKEVSPYIIFPTKEDKWMHQTMLSMYQERMQKDYLYNESETLYVKQIFIHLIRHYEMMAVVSNPINHTRENHIVALMGYITVNYDHISLKDTAAFFGYNETYLGQILQRYTGKKFCTLINELQMTNAKRLLEETNMSITEIGCEVGCYDASHFTRKFKAMYGASPNAYRKSLKKDERNFTA